MENPNFLKNKYNLHNTPEVESAVKRTEARTREELPQDPEERIQNYLNRFTEIIERKEPAKREQGIKAIKKVLHDKFIIKPEEIPENYFTNQQRLAREQGHGDIEISEEMREQLTEVVITDQKNSLDQWIDYLSSDDATYPDWLKYYAFRSILSMGDYDKERKQFSKRSKGTVKPFPDINREALALVLDAIEKKTQKQEINIQTPNEEEKQEFTKLLQGENFSKLYAFAIDKVTPTSESELANVAGEWVKYRQGKDHMPLVKSLQGHGTGWCTAGESTAKTQLANGDFYVYYSLDKDGKSNIPRAAIRMQGDSIAEVRGIGPDQNLDPFIGDIVKTKLANFSDGQAYEKKSADMKLLTDIEKKTQQAKQLTKNELIFLYEINNTIEGFGYERDPRIKELRDQRNPQEDAPIVFACRPEQIAYKQEDINENTKAYIGELFPGIFKSGIEFIYTSFPEGKLEKYNIEIGGKDKDELVEEMKNKNIYISDWAKDLLNNKDFVTSKNSEKIDLIRLTVKDLGFSDYTTTDEIYKKALELGLELCPAEVGPQLRLQNSTKEWTLVAMKQIPDRNGYPDVFSLYWNGDQLVLRSRRAEPSNGWDSGDRFVFRLRKLEA
jgi:hypothetical protein